MYVLRSYYHIVDLVWREYLKNRNFGSYWQLISCFQYVGGRVDLELVLRKKIGPMLQMREPLKSRTGSTQPCQLVTANITIVTKRVTLKLLLLSIS
jgi:hypothetical protein